jgi:hypothetical protein
MAAASSSYVGNHPGGSPQLRATGSEAAACAAAAAAEPAAAAAAALVDKSGDGEDLLQQIARLKREQNLMRANKKKIAKELRNAERRKARLKRKARQLTDTDLVEVIRLRATASAENAATKVEAAAFTEAPPAPVTPPP